MMFEVVVAESCGCSTDCGDDRDDVEITIFVLLNRFGRTLRFLFLTG